MPPMPSRPTVGAQRPKRHVRQALTLVAATAALVVGVAPAAQAQREVPKIGNICPLGYVDLLNGRCSTLGLIEYTLQPTQGEACPSGWMNVGGGYCREK
jgi:hypothetical protein